MTEEQDIDQELFNKALILIQEGLKVPPYKFAELIIAFAKDNKESLS